MHTFKTLIEWFEDEINILLNLYSCLTLFDSRWTFHGQQKS